MDAHSLLKLASELRKAQKDYFTTRDSLVLKRAKSLEKRFDYELANYFYQHDDPQEIAQNNSQMELFDLPLEPLI